MHRRRAKMRMHKCTAGSGVLRACMIELSDRSAREAEFMLMHKNMHPRLCLAVVEKMKDVQPQMLQL